MLATELLFAWNRQDPTRRLVAAVSGGADSVAMLIAMVEVGWSDRIHVAHFNHQWRGPESDADQQFVIDLCQQLSLPLTIGNPTQSSDQYDFAASREAAMHAKEFSSGQLNASNHVDVSSPSYTDAKTEESARKRRYDFLIHTAYQTGASYVATAHNADDRVETILHNLLRGTGLNGIASLNITRPLHDDLILVRPLLHARRSDIESFLTARRQSFRIDSTNSSLDYARNFIRHQLLPIARVRYRQCDENLLKFSDVVEETLDDLNAAARAWLQLVERTRRARFAPAPNNTSTDTLNRYGLPEHWRAGDYWILPIECLQDRAVIWPILREALRMEWLQRRWPLGDMSRRHWLALREWLLSDTQSKPSPTPADLEPEWIETERQAAAPSGHDPNELARKELGLGEFAICVVLPGGVRLERAPAAWALGRPLVGAGLR